MIEVDVKQLIQVINGVLRSVFAKLTNLPEESLQDLADQLYTSDLISKAAKKNPTMDKFISEFCASLEWLRSQSAIQIHSAKFLSSLKSVGGSYSMAASVLCEDLIKAVNDKLNCDFCIDFN